MTYVIDVLFDQLNLSLIIIALVVFTPLQIIIPARSHRGHFRPGWAVDVLHVVLSGIPIRAGLMCVMIMALAIGDVLTPPELQDFVASQPLWLQVLLCTVIADAGFYLAHRAMHEIPWLWRFHAIHHSSEHLDWLAAYRVHPVDQVIVKGSSLIPVFVIGFAPEAIGIASVIYAMQALFIHSNIRIGFGRLGWMAASPEFHHWHHANEPAAFNKNYAGQLPLLDKIFGTLHAPGHFPSRYGTDDPVPEGYAGQLAFPFRRASHAPGAVADGSTNDALGREAGSD